MKNILKRVNVLLMVMMLVSLCACSIGDNDESSSSKKSEKSEKIKVYKESDFEDIANESIETLFELTCDGEYIDMMMPAGEIKDIIDELSELEIDEDQDMLVIYIGDKENASKYLEKESGMDLEDLSDAAINYLESASHSMIISMINSKSGTYYVAAASLLRTSSSYVVDKFDEQLWIIPTDNEEVYVYVSFICSGENVLTVNSGYLFDSDGIKDIEKTAKKYFDVEYQERN